MSSITVSRVIFELIKGEMVYVEDLKHRNGADGCSLSSVSWTHICRCTYSPYKSKTNL